MIRPLAAGGLILLMAGCTGRIQEATDAPGAPSPTSSVTPPSGPGPVATGGGDCRTFTPAPTRVWRLTHTQFRNTVRDTFGFTVPVLETLPAESRLDGYANASERLAL